MAFNALAMCFNWSYSPHPLRQLFRPQVSVPLQHLQCLVAGNGRRYGHGVLYQNRYPGVTLEHVHLKYRQSGATEPDTPGRTVLILVKHGAHIRMARRQDFKQPCRVQPYAFYRPGRDRQVWQIQNHLPVQCGDNEIAGPLTKRLLAAHHGPSRHAVLPLPDIQSCQ
jgi:hypothetical protein